MRKYIVRPLQGTLVLLTCLASGTWAQADQLKLVNTNANYVMGGVYTSPYGISVNGGSPELMICDDFTTDVSVGDTWSATPTTLASIEAGTNPSGTPKFGTDVQKYATAAVLATELMTLPNLASVAAGEISYALWGIFDPVLLTSTNNPYGSITSQQLTAAQNYLSAAQTMVASAITGGIVDFSKILINNQWMVTGLTIYTPNPLAVSQEFLKVSYAAAATSMDEPSYAGILAVDLLAVVGAIVFFRRRLAGMVS